MSSTNNIKYHLNNLSLSKFHLLTDTIYKDKFEKKKNLKIKNIYSNPNILFSKKSIFPKSNLIRNNNNNLIYSFEKIKDDTKINQFLFIKKSLSPNRFNKNIQSRNQISINNEIKNFLFNENKKMFYSEDNELKYIKSSKDSLSILKDFNSLNNLFIHKDYKKKKLDDKIINILRTELLNAKTSSNLRNVNVKFKFKKKKFKSNPSIYFTKSNLDIKRNNNNNNKKEKIHLNLFSKIKLYCTPPFFEINSNATKKSIINDTKIMTGFEKYNFSKIE